jgi:hypothetical protein
VLTAHTELTLAGRSQIPDPVGVATPTNQVSRASKSNGLSRGRNRHAAPPTPNGQGRSADHLDDRVHHVTMKNPGRT